MPGITFTKEWKRNNQDLIDVYGHPTCNDCGHKLSFGDNIGPHWPVRKQFTRCRSCQTKEVQESKQRRVS